jgi:hypothetical protein
MSDCRGLARDKEPDKDTHPSKPGLYCPHLTMVHLLWNCPPIVNVVLYYIYNFTLIPDLLGILACCRRK